MLNTTQSIYHGGNFKFFDAPLEAVCSQEEGPKKGFVMGSRTQGVQEILKIYIYIGCPHPKSELGDGTRGAGPLRAVLNSNSFADNLWHGHLTYL